MTSINKFQSIRNQKWGDRLPIWGKKLLIWGERVLFWYSKATKTGVYSYQYGYFAKGYQFGAKSKNYIKI
jgi:hypothetical protein